MADEEVKSEIFFPTTLIAWERIKLPPVPDQFQFQSQSPVLSDPHGREETLSTPTMHEDHRTSVVFPPTNHEDLIIHQHEHYDQEINNERARRLSPVSSPRSKPEAMWGSVGVRWWCARLKLSGIVSCLRTFSVRGGLLRSLNFPLVGSMVLLLLLYLRLRHRRRLRRESIDQLLSVIKEKDERIHQLLHQIARMNEVLLATHHGVPLIFKSASG